MRNTTLHNEADGKNYIRVSKNRARKEYLNGRDVVICAVNMNPFHPYWGIGQTLNRRYRETYVADETGVKNDFDNWSASYVYYNCVNAETGRYAAYYIAMP